MLASDSVPTVRFGRAGGRLEAALQHARSAPGLLPAEAAPGHAELGLSMRPEPAPLDNSDLKEAVDFRDATADNASAWWLHSLPSSSSNDGGGGGLAADNELEGAIMELDASIIGASASTSMSRTRGTAGTSTSSIAMAMLSMPTI